MEQTLLQPTMMSGEKLLKMYTSSSLSFHIMIYEENNVVGFPPSYLLSNQGRHYWPRQWVLFVSCPQSLILSGWKDENWRTAGIISLPTIAVSTSYPFSPMACQKKRKKKVQRWT